MEVDSLRSIVHSTPNSGMEIAAKNVRIAHNVADKLDASKDTQSTENPENSKNIKPNHKNQVGFEPNNKKTQADILYNKEVEDARENVSNEFFERFIEDANKKIFATNREFDYSVHDATNRVVIKVLDRTTKEVIREIPPEKRLDAAAKMMELVGIIIDKKI